LSTFGRRGSRESGWNWSTPPAGPRTRPPPPPLPPFAGGAAVRRHRRLLAVWLVRRGRDPAPGCDRHTGGVRPTATGAFADAVSRLPPVATPIPSPTAHHPGPFSLAVWDGTLARPTRRGGRLGKAVPSSCCESPMPRRGVSDVTIRYTCRPPVPVGGSIATAAAGRPGRGPQPAGQHVVLPDDPDPADDREGGHLSLLGELFQPVELAEQRHPAPTEGLNVKLVAGRDTSSCSGAPSAPARRKRLRCGSPSSRSQESGVSGSTLPASCPRQ
jgi:hypothetical protein